MRRRSPLLQMVDDQIVSSGLQPDRHSLKRLLWDAAANVSFAQGKIRRKVPAATAFNIGSADPIRGISQQFAENGGRWLWAAANRRIARWQFGSPESLTTTFGTGYQADQSATQRPTFYDFTHYGDWTIVNNSVDQPRIHKPPAALADYAPGQAPIGAVLFMKKMNFMMAIGYGARGTRVGWSDADNIELWTAAEDNLAGSISIDEFDTPIRAGNKIGDSISVFSEDQMALVKYISSPFIFGQKAVLDGIGAVGKAATATDTRVNVGISRAGVWWTDGASSRYIDEGFLSDYLQDGVNWDQASKCVAARNDYTGCFEFFFPMTGSNVINEGWSWDPKTGGWSPVPFASMMDERRIFQYPLQGDNVGNILFTDFDPTASAAMILETKPLVMSTSESPHVSVRLDELDLLLHAATSVEFRLGSCGTPNGDWEWSEWIPVEAGADIKEIPEVPEAPFWKLALRSTPGVANWDIDLQGFLLYGVPVGVKE